MRNTKQVRLLILGGVVLLTGLLGTAPAATLANRYSFDDPNGQTTATDSVGGQHGTLMNGAYFDGAGSVYLNTTVPSSDPTGDYIALPANIMTGYTAITIETWYTPVHNPAAYADWNRIWDFGNSQDNSGASTSYFFLRSGNETYGLRGDITIMQPARNSQGLDGPTVPNYTQSHVVWTSDGETGIARIYVNGMLVASTTGFTNTPAMVGPTTNNWIGRSQWGADPYLNASFTEFRIYNGALTPLEVAGSYTAGPATPSTDYGQITAIDLQLPTSLLKGASANAQVMASASKLGFQVGVTGEPGLTFASSNPGVLSVDASGRVTAVALGSATITATFVHGGRTNTDSQLVSVLNLPPRLLHRWSFNDTGSPIAVDSVAGADGNLEMLAEQRDGQAVLSGQALSYVTLPPDLINTNTMTRNAITFETWASFGANNNWVNLFMFGNSVGGAGGNHVWFSPHSGGGDHRFIISHTQPGWSGGGEQGVYIPGFLDNRTNVHLVCLVDFGRDMAAVYTNGVLAGLNTAMTRELSAIINNFSYLGRSSYDADPYLNGSIDEFRIYDGALSAQQIVAGYLAGPDSTNNAPGNFIGLALQMPTTLTAEWQARGRVLGNWQNAPNVDLMGDVDLVLASSDTNVLRVSAAGLLTAVAPGTATITASYQGNVATQQITVVAPTATLVHRYSFNETVGDVVTDLVGGAHGHIMIGTNTVALTNAAWTGAGELVLNTNTTLGVFDTYVDLPDGIISRLTNNATFEAWVTVLSGDDWARIFDFGSLPGGDAASGVIAEPGIFFARAPRFDWVVGNGVAGNLVAGSLTTGAKAHLVVLYNDLEDMAKIFINGAQVGVTAPGAVRLNLGAINDTNVWLGRSLYSAPITPTWYDPYLRAAYDEFRIYSGLLTASQIAANYAIGPNPPETRPTLSVVRDAANVKLVWPTSAAGFAPYAAGSLDVGAPWTPVGGTPTVVGDLYQLAVPIGEQPRFFRLQK